MPDRYRYSQGKYRKSRRFIFREDSKILINVKLDISHLKNHEIPYKDRCIRTNAMIETLSQNNIAEFLPLIREYQKFYHAQEISDENNERFFSQFNTSNPLGSVFLFREGLHLAGFATVYFTYASTITSKVATLNDLYTLPQQRKNGIALQLIEHCRTFAKDQGATRLQWLTSPDNHTAQSLYDGLNTQKSTWHFYTYPTE